MMDLRVPRPAVCTVVLLVALLCGCDLPRDADSTLQRVRQHELRVGVTNHPPWVELTDGQVRGVEPALVRELARGLGAEPTFHPGSESELLEALRRGELDLVAGGLADGSPWNGRVALTKPYLTDTATGTNRVLALRAGENAWLVHVERFLQSEPARAVAIASMTR